MHKVDKVLWDHAVALLDQAIALELARADEEDAQFGYASSTLYIAGGHYGLYCRLAYNQVLADYRNAVPTHPFEPIPLQ